MSPHTAQSKDGGCNGLLDDSDELELIDVSEGCLYIRPSSNALSPLEPDIDLCTAKYDLLLAASEAAEWATGKVLAGESTISFKLSGSSAIASTELNFNVSLQPKDSII